LGQSRAALAIAAGGQGLKEDTVTVTRARNFFGDVAIQGNFLMGMS
jgi:hypothetical protein